MIISGLNQNPDTDRDICILDRVTELISDDSQ